MVVSIGLDRRWREEDERLGVNIRELIEKALGEEVERRVKAIFTGFYHRESFEDKLSGGSYLTG